MLIDGHRGAFEYDWRTRFQLGLDAVPDVMGWGEAYRLTELLANDPSSQVAAALAGWLHPLSRGEITLIDLYDLQHASKAKRKPKRYPRPWDKPPKTYGKGTSMTPAEYRALREQLAGKKAAAKKAPAKKKAAKKAARKPAKKTS